MCFKDDNFDAALGEQKTEQQAGRPSHDTDAGADICHPAVLL
jgi:hypothetical protein